MKPVGELGATVGESVVDRWMSDVDRWTIGSPGAGCRWFTGWIQLIHGYTTVWYFPAAAPNDLPRVAVRDLPCRWPGCL